MYKGWITSEVVQIYLFFPTDKKKVLKLYISHLKIKLFEINSIIFKLVYLLRENETRIKHLFLDPSYCLNFFYHYLVTTRTF